MPNVIRPKGRFFSVLLSVLMAILLGRSLAIESNGPSSSSASQVRGIPGSVVGGEPQVLRLALGREAPARSLRMTDGGVRAADEKQIPRGQEQPAPDDKFRATFRGGDGAARKSVAAPSAGELMLLARADGIGVPQSGSKQKSVPAPVLTQILEGLFGSKSGADKKAAALSFVQTAIGATDAVVNKNIADPNKFTDGLGKVVDGVVACLNASVWASK